MAAPTEKIIYANELSSCLRCGHCLLASWSRVVRRDFQQALDGFRTHDDGTSSGDESGASLRHNVPAEFADCLLSGANLYLAQCEYCGSRHLGRRAAVYWLCWSSYVHHVHVRNAAVATFRHQRVLSALWV